jgi:hypothetical protein
VTGRSLHAEGGILGVLFLAVVLAFNSWYPWWSNQDTKIPLSAVRECTVAPLEVRGRIASHRDWNFALFTTGYASFRVCEGGLLSFSARGSSVRGVGAHTTVSAGDSLLLDREVKGEEFLALIVPERSHILIAFHNDGSEGQQDRNLWVENIKFDSSR